MLVHLLLTFTSVDEARSHLQSTHGTSIAGVVLCSDDLEPEVLGATVPEVANRWMTPVSVLADRAVPIDTSRRRGWSFVRASREERGVVCASDIEGAAGLADVAGDGEVAVVLHPAVSFEALAGVVDHLIVDAREPGSARVDRRAVARLAREAARHGRSRADTRRWQVLEDIATLAPLGEGLQDPGLELAEGWAVGARDLVPVGQRSEARPEPVKPGETLRVVY
ncbi:MAG: hypothetical protein MSC31_15275 [Solirubrobacteraceae bacterium MAG38_C4-C5]|nr:hypothetical protein [Candidatus Siliceabacter maunaloa]